MENQTETEQNSLKKMFKLQEDLQKALGNLPILSDIQRQAFIEKMTLALVDEGMEALRETPWKDWKKNQSYNQENFKKEIIDIWHITINLSIIAGFTADDIEAEFTEKNVINHLRQKASY